MNIGRATVSLRHLIVGAVLAVAVVGGTVLSTFKAHAADHMVNPGESIQAAIDGAANGETIVVNAGEYAEQLNIRKPLTIRGVGNVVIKTQSTDPAANKGADIQNTTNVTLENLTFDGESNSPTAQTGVDVNSVAGVILRDITVQNYAKNGIAVTTQFAAGYQPGGDIVFDDVTVSGAHWAGIAFYEGIGGPMSDVRFLGWTVIENTQYGLQFGDGTNSGAVTGGNYGSGTINLGTVRFRGNDANISNDQSDLQAFLSGFSTTDDVDGVRHARASDFPGMVMIDGGPDHASNIAECENREITGHYVSDYGEVFLICSDDDGGAGGGDWLGSAGDLVFENECRGETIGIGITEDGRAYRECDDEGEVEQTSVGGRRVAVPGVPNTGFSQ